MLKIVKISKKEIPEFVWKKFTTNIINDFGLAFYKSEGMFGIEPDYLLVLKSEGEQHFGYVYNGNAPECSEFGSFGLNKEKTERIW